MAILFLKKLKGLKKKRQRAKLGSIILISLRDFEKDKADVLHVYNEEETKTLLKAEKVTKTLNELPVGLRQSVFLNSFKEFVFDERKFSYLLQMQGRV